MNKPTVIGLKPHKFEMRGKKGKKPEKPITKEGKKDATQ